MTGLCSYCGVKMPAGENIHQCVDGGKAMQKARRMTLQEAHLAKTLGELLMHLVYVPSPFERLAEHRPKKLPKGRSLKAALKYGA